VFAYVNGQYVPIDRPALTVNDRSFLYGDGLFETIRITNGRPFLWREHLERLHRGADFLKIPFAWAHDEIEFAARHLLAQNDTREGVVRIHLSRGPSERGYGFPADPKPTLVITTHKSIRNEHPGLKLITSTIRVLADDPLTQHKTANRLPNILARQEADAAGADEALILNHHNQIAEASAANVFIVRGNQLITPPLKAGALAGMTRAYILKIAPEHKLIPVEAAVSVGDLRNADAVFLTSAHWLATPAISLDGMALSQSGVSIVKALYQACDRIARC
jgi:aminodeoxychorismate lyase